jgi:mono/diheme cytochrome c family protein
MLKRSLLFTLFLAPLAALHAADAPQARLDEKHRVFFKDNCLSCHNAEKQNGKVRLDDIAFSVDSVEKADNW